jgi:hypothetical protein
MSDAEKAAYYRENPTMARVTQEMQNLFTNYTLLGKIQNQLNPDFVTQQALIARGIDPTGVNATQLAAVANEGYTGLANLGYTREQQSKMIADAIADKSTQAPADVRDIGSMVGYQSVAERDLMSSLQSSDYGREASQTGMVTTPSGQTVSNAATIAAQDAANFGVVSTGGGYGSVGEAASTGMTTVNGVTYSNDATIAAQDAATFGTDAASSNTGGGGRSSKIVCTAMNEAYGFGSFRNAVWLAYAQKNLTKEHEVGYHTLFLPLVNYAYKQGNGITHRMLRKVLENIARHRSADLRAEMRGLKRDTVGRVYRAVLEPICYAVGKMKK